MLLWVMHGSDNSASVESGREEDFLLGRRWTNIVIGHEDMTSPEWPRLGLFAEGGACHPGSLISPHHHLHGPMSSGGSSNLMVEHQRIIWKYQEQNDDLCVSHELWTEREPAALRLHQPMWCRFHGLWSSSMPWRSSVLWLWRSYRNVPALDTGELHVIP